MTTYRVKFQDKDGDSHVIEVGAKDVPTAIISTQELYPEAVRIIACKPSDMFWTMSTSQEDPNRLFVNDLFDKLLGHTDKDMIDLHDDDSCCDHIEFKRLETTDDW